jgi:transcriptional accessory protein Tex/SPT6
MPTIEEFQLHPYGWENDPEEERYRLSTLDYLSTTTFTNTAFFFRLKDSEKTYANDSIYPEAKITNNS